MSKQQVFVDGREYWHVDILDAKEEEIEKLTALNAHLMQSNLEEQKEFLSILQQIQRQLKKPQDPPG